MYNTGQGVVKDNQVALSWYLKSAEKGNIYAQNNLGVMYDNGVDGVLENDIEALKWYLKAAEQGYADAQYNSALMYDLGGKGVLEDDKKAVKWYRKLAQRGYANAQYNLGVMYQHGEGVTKDMAKAKYWIKKAYESDDSEASRAAEDNWNKFELWKY